MAAPPPGADADAKLFSLLLRASDCPEAASWVPPGERRRVVFLHGWLQDHASWLTTAHRVRARHGHDCLLLDWPAHGRSPAPADPAVLSATTLVGCLRRLLERAGWAGARGRLVLAGCSMGGAVAMRYANLHADEVDRLVLVAPAGFEEPWYMLSRPGPLLSRLCSLPLLPPWLRGRLSIVRHTPLYQNAPDWFATPVARRTPTLLVFAQFDELHRAQAWAGCRASDPILRLRRVLANHPLLCSALGALRLDRDAEAWHAAPGSERPGERQEGPPRAAALSSSSLSASTSPPSPSPPQRAAAGAELRARL